MTLTPSKMVELGFEMPSFTLPDPRSGEQVSSDELMGKRGVLVGFICNHCPYVVHIRDRFNALYEWCAQADIGLVMISSNNAESHPQDGPDAMARLAEELGWSFPYLYDESQDVARSFHAACTPDFFLFDSNAELYYRGQFDDTRPRSGGDATGDDIHKAISHLAAAAPPPGDQTASMGCNIKWK